VNFEELLVIVIGGVIEVITVAYRARLPLGFFNPIVTTGHNSPL